MNILYIVNFPIAAMTFGNEFTTLNGNFPLYPSLLSNYCKNKYYNITLCYLKFLRVQNFEKNSFLEIKIIFEELIA